MTTQQDDVGQEKDVLDTHVPQDGCCRSARPNPHLSFTRPGQSSHPAKMVYVSLNFDSNYNTNHHHLDPQKEQIVRRRREDFV